MSDYTIGREVYRSTDVPDVMETWRVVRIVGKSISLIQDATGAYLQAESYVELKSGTGRIMFVVLTSERTPYAGPVSAIKGLEPINFEGDTV